MYNTSSKYVKIAEKGLAGRYRTTELHPMKPRGNNVHLRRAKNCIQDSSGNNYWQFYINVCQFLMEALVKKNLSLLLLLSFFFFSPGI